MSKEKLIELYDKKKWSLKKISEYFSISESSVYRLMVKYGILMRPAVKPEMLIPPKEDLKKLYYGDGKTLKEIADIYNTTRNMVSKWFNTLGLEISYFKAHKIPSRKEITNFYLKEKLTIKQLCCIYKVNRKIINKWLKHYNIEIRSPQRKYAHLRAVSLTRHQKEFIVGTLLGDAYLNNKNVLEIKHSENQLKYLLWKKDIMSNYVNYIRKREGVLKGYEKVYVYWSWHTIRLPELSYFRKLFYKNNKKVINDKIANFLTPFAMAVWVMDDGWRQGSLIKISSESFNEDEHNILKWLVKLNFDINLKICVYNRNGKKYNYISFNKRNSTLLTKLIEPYVIESMRYKLVI